MILLNKDENTEYSSSGLFKSDGIWCHPRRVIDTYEIIFVYEGTAYICEDGIEYELGANDILILEPGKLHYGYRESENFVSFMWLHFKICKKQHCSLPKHMHMSEPYMLKNLFAQCLHTVNTPTYSPVCADLYTALILEEIASEQKTRAYAGRQLSANIREWIRLNIEKDISVCSIARHFGYHENHVSRVFKEAYGVGLKDYIIKMKLDNAKNLLSASLYSVKQISRILSFRSENHFIKFFKYHVKITPTEYRNTYINTHVNKS